MKKRKVLVFLSMLSLLFSSCANKQEEKKDDEPIIESGETPSGKKYVFEDVDERPITKTFTISSESELVDFQEKVNAKNEEYVTGYFELSADIELKNEWTPINGFQGQFNGKNHLISGIKIDSSKNKRGFFSYIDGAKIGQITFSGEMTAGDTSALVAGYSLGDCTFVGVYTKGKINSANNVGGLVGSISSGSVKAVGCVNLANIKANSYVGGLIGANKTFKVNISDSANYGYITTKGEMVAGIIGSMTNSTSEVNDYNLVDCFNYGIIKGSSYVGGVVGLSCCQLIRCGAGKDSKVYQVKGNEEILAKTLTSFNSPYCSVLCGNLLYNLAINECGELIECQNENGFAITGINDPAGCTRVIKFKDKVMIFAATNKYAVSDDGGHTFGRFTTVSSKATELCPIDGEASTDTGNTQPYVLPDGRIVIMYRAIRVSTSFSYGSLRMRISDENGAFNSSDEPIVLIENYTSNTGKAGAFYEPYPILLDDGTIAIYISEDVHYTERFDNGVYHIEPLKTELVCEGGSQDTVMIPLKVAAGATEVGAGKIEVGEPQLIFQGSNTNMFGHSNSRPGMTVITQLYDGSYAMTLENSTEQHTPGYNLVTQITYSQDGRTWTAPRTIIRPHQDPGSTNGINKLYKCCAPFCATLPDGRLVITCATDEEYVGLYPNDDAHYKHEIAFITKNRIGYNDDIERDRDLIQIGSYAYSENEYCVWASCAVVDGRIYISGLQGVNYLKQDGTLASPTDWVLLSTINYQDLYNNLGITELA